VIPAGRPFLPSLILVPFVGMFVLTLVVWIVMYWHRIRAIRASGITPQTRADLDTLPPRAVSSSANLQNLFELPVVFYACVLALIVTNRVDALDVACAFGFLLFRILHSAIHCTYNDVMQRFMVYAVSSLFLWVMVLHLTILVLGDVLV
jgi:hypothetical protein